MKDRRKRVKRADGSVYVSKKWMGKKGSIGIGGAGVQRAKVVGVSWLAYGKMVGTTSAQKEKK